VRRHDVQLNPHLSPAQVGERPLSSLRNDFADALLVLRLHERLHQRNASTDAFSDAFSDAEPDAEPDALAYGQSDALANAVAYSQPDSVSDSDPDPEPDSESDAIADAIADAGVCLRSRVPPRPFLLVAQDGHFSLRRALARARRTGWQRQVDCARW